MKAIALSRTTLSCVRLLFFSPLSSLLFSARAAVSDVPDNAEESWSFQAPEVVDFAFGELSRQYDCVWLM